VIDRQPAGREPKDNFETGTFLTVPGWNGSGPRHWQSLWESKYPYFRRIEQRDWERPKREEWVDSIENAVEAAEPPVFLIAHSLGCVAVAHWAARHGAAGVAGALMVAPPWLAPPMTCPEALLSFLPMPTGPLPFDSLVVASETDPYLPIDLAAGLAQSWRSRFINAGSKGHINVESGHGPWPLGEQLLTSLCHMSRSKTAG
jgi:predicted alpha/beta hydrolase family esterase